MAKSDQGIGCLVTGIVMAVLGGMGLMGALIFLMIGGVFSAVFPAVFGMPFEDLDLDRDGITCQGVLTSVNHDSSLTVNNQATVRLTYRYDTGSGPRDGEVTVMEDHSLVRTSPGTPITVEYLPNDHAVSRIQGTRAAIAGWAGAMGLGFGVFGAIATAACLLMLIVGAIVIVRYARRRKAGGRG